MKFLGPSVVFFVFKKCGMMTAMQGLIDFHTFLGLQNLCSFFRFALFDMSSWADFKRVNRHIPSCNICDKMFILVHLLSVIVLDIFSNGTISSKISIVSSILSIITIDLVSLRSQGWTVSRNQIEGIKYCLRSRLYVHPE